MKAALAIFAALMYSSTSMGLAVKSWKGQDDHGQSCGLMLGFVEGKLKTVMVQALADETGNKKPVKVWEMMMPEQFDKLIKSSGSLKSGKFYLSAKDSLEAPGVSVKKNMGLAIDLKRGTVNYEKHESLQGRKASVLMSCVGLKEFKEDLPPDPENNPCDLEENAALRNMCVVEAGKKKGTIPEGAVASPAAK